MKSLKDLAAPLLDQIDLKLKPIKSKLFGSNNDTIDFLMDSFYKLAPEQRAGVLLGSAVAAVMMGIGVLWFYFARVDALEQDLNRSFNALHELRSLKQQYQVESARYERLVGSVSRVSNTFRAKPFFEEKAQTIGIEMQGVNEVNEPIPLDNPLSQRLGYIKVSVRLPKISIPRLMTLITEVEKSGNFLSVKDLTIRNRLGTKLYFDADVEFRGYRAEGM